MAFSFLSYFFFILPQTQTHAESELFLYLGILAYFMQQKKKEKTGKF